MYDDGIATQLDFTVLEFLSLSAAFVSAGAAVFIAQKANTIALNGNAIATQNNDISLRATKLESDKHLIEWAQRVLNCVSLLVSLRLLSDKDVTGKDKQDAFAEKRRELRSQLYALKEEGQLFLSSKHVGDLVDQPALNALHVLAEIANGKTFKPPAANDYDEVRKPQVKSIRDQARTFLAGVQSRVGDHWTR